LRRGRKKKDLKHLQCAGECCGKKDKLRASPHPLKREVKEVIFSYGRKKKEKNPGVP